jgi:peptidoglycan/xylan/chitin deacetylase (PgdA/CDA1 family)
VNVAQTQWVALVPIFFGGVRAYNAGDTVPDANVALYHYAAQGLVEQVDRPEQGGTPADPFDERTAALLATPTSETAVALRATVEDAIEAGDIEVGGGLTAQEIAADPTVKAATVSVVRTGSPEAVATASRAALPRVPKPIVVLSFDDSYLTDFTVVKPILDSKGVKATFCAVTTLVGTSNHVSWSQLRQLQAEGHEIANHSATHVSLDVADAALIKTEVADAYATLTAQNLDVVGWAYPQSASSADSRREVRRLHRYGLGGISGGGGTRMPIWTYAIGRQQLNSTTTVASLTAMVDSYIANPGILCFLNHSGSGLDANGQATLAAVIDYCQANGVAIMRARDAVEAYANVVDVGDQPGGSSYLVVDGAGRLWSPEIPNGGPLSISGALNSVTAATTPEAFTAGKITYTSIAAAQNTDWPVTADTGTVITNRVNSSNPAYTIQQFISSKGAVHTRRATSATAWNSWNSPTAEIAGTPGTAAVGDPVTAYISGTTLTRCLANTVGAPTTVAGLLITTRPTTSASYYTYASQEYRAIGNAGVWQRMATSATAWTAWKALTLT